MVLVVIKKNLLAIVVVENCFSELASSYGKRDKLDKTVSRTLIWYVRCETTDIRRESTGG
jgi:hypothetical protein